MELDHSLTPRLDDFESRLHSMPNDDLVSLTGFEAADLVDEESQSDHQDIANNLYTTSAGGFDGNLNAFASVLAQSDPLGHLRDKLQTLNTKVDQIESSISNKVSKKTQSYVASLVSDALKAHLPSFLLKALKESLPLIQDSIH
ncbi:hypothetical protein Tco_0981635 [Tanacetum coccineum]